MGSLMMEMINMQQENITQLPALLGWLRAVEPFADGHQDQNDGE